MSLIVGSLLKSFTRLSVGSATKGNVPVKRLIFTNGNPLLFWATPALMAEPLKKKKKLDPAIIKAREEKRKRRLEKSIRKLEKSERQLKPIDELHVPYSLIQEKELRKRPLPVISQEEQEYRTNLGKEWTRYKYVQHFQDAQVIDRVLMAQQKALDELRAVSEQLYFEAVQIDVSLVPFSAKGPTLTPPIKEYDVPDGEIQDISRKWD